ncbi:MAG: Tripartite tricarboxylate transporter family receptor [Rubritepida sp.]|nr:Tripartite tricarboxylate transporter family receptor [Rubritepida sp.]
MTRDAASTLSRRHLLAGLCALPTVARAQAPWVATRSISMVVPFAAGGTSDVMARLLAEPLGQRLGQAVVVENVTGAGGNVGAERVARAAGDGHTALFAHVGVFSVNKHLYRTIGFDSVRDFAPVGLVCTNPMVLIVSERSGIASLEQLADRARLGNLRIATAGAGSTMHLAALQFLDATHGRADLIPYRGGAPAVNDLLAGQVDVIIEQAFSAIPNTRNGMARALLVTGSGRLPAIPEVPTATEAGLPGIDIEIWNAITLPIAAPSPVRAAWEAALSAGLGDPNVRRRYEQFMGRIPTGEEATSAHLGTLIAEDTRRWGSLLSQSNAARLD